MKVLIVEDNAQNRKLFSVLVEAMGHACLTAEDGETGIEMARLEQPDLILMDIQMPRLDGLSALARLRADTASKDIPVIALTSYAMKGDRERFLAKGFTDYMEKPINKHDFMELIEKYTRAAGNR